MLAVRQIPSSKRRIGTFKQEAFDLLIGLGGQETEHTNVYLLETQCGDLSVKIQEDWLQAVFSEPERAAERLSGSRFHPSSGKWIWSGKDCLPMFKIAVKKIQDEQLEINMKQSTFNSRKEKFMKAYDRIEGSSAGKQFLRIMEDLNSLALTITKHSPKAQAFYQATAAGKIEVLFRDIYPVLKRHNFPPHGSPQLVTALDSVKLAVWLKAK